jgi:PAS domain S-box-containing protein
MRRALPQQYDEAITRHMIDDAPIAVSVVGSNSRIIWVNKEMCRFLGYSQVRLVGKSISDITHPDDRPGTVKVLTDMWKSDVPIQRYEKRYVHKSGRTVWGEVSVRLVPASSGSPTFSIAHILDITARKKAELELQASEARYRQLHESMEKSLLRTNAGLERKVEERTLKLRKLAGELTQAEHKERRRIAYVLHEDIQQRLVAMQYQVQAVIKGDRTDRMPETARRMLGELDNIVQLTRTLSSDLRPPVLYELGLMSALDWLAGDLKKKFGIQVDVRGRGGDRFLSDELRMFAFEAVRELLLNAVKHAGVKRAAVQVKPGSRGTLVITVTDKGAGFNAGKSLASPGTFGLFSIHERAVAFGGSFKVSSEPGQGTMCSITLPAK